MLNIVKAGSAKVTDRQLKADAKDRLMSAMVHHAATEAVNSVASPAIARHVLVVALKAMNVGADGDALEASANEAFDAVVSVIQADLDALQALADAQEDGGQKVA